MAAPEESQQQIVEKKEDKKQVDSKLESALKKGSIQIAPPKAETIFTTKPDKKGKSNKQKKT
jgi:hypothetical protein